MRINARGNHLRIASIGHMPHAYQGANKLSDQIYSSQKLINPQREVINASILSQETPESKNQISFDYTLMLSPLNQNTADTSCGI